MAGLVLPFCQLGGPSLTAWAGCDRAALAWWRAGSGWWAAWRNWQCRASTASERPPTSNPPTPSSPFYHPIAKYLTNQMFFPSPAKYIVKHSQISCHPKPNIVSFLSKFFTRIQTHHPIQIYLPYFISPSQVFYHP